MARTGKAARAMERLSGLAQLALAESVVKACKAATDPRGGAHGAPNLRTEADDALREAYELEGVDRKRIVIGGVEVGTLSARVSKPAEVVEPEIENDIALVDWLRETDGGRDALVRLVTGYRTRQAVLDAATADGELPGGCRMVERREPARWLGTALRVKPEKVAAALAGELPQAVAGLLGGEAE